MGNKVTFILGIHNHQPVGNFDHVIEEAYQKAYKPFLDVMGDYPDIPLAMHTSGILYDWFEEKHPEYLEKLAVMVSSGQVEIMSAGYYEPILTVIPERDRRGQLSMMRDYVNGRFMAHPRGCWLTERIWDPHLPDTLARAGLEYVIVDDSHFKSTGFRSESMRGYFLTEESGAYVKVFPIDKRLRYLIPFHDPHEAIDYFRSVSQEPGEERSITVLADDGEKFGLWTGTHSLCYKKNWLRRFCDALLENSDWLEISTFSRVIDETPPRGIVYLPTASYSEMMEWALPLSAQLVYQEARDILSGSGALKEPAEVLKGGFWRNFLVKYEESNWMHKRMMQVSGALEAYRGKAGHDETWNRARRHLYQAQCNCAYWHGLFGGLYLPHLRSAVFKHLVEAESLVENKTSASGRFLRYERGDIDGDGVEELSLSTTDLKAVFKLKGAVLRELDSRDPAFNLTDTLTRRKEIYHEDLAGLDDGPAGNSDIEALSIHNVLVAKEKGLARRLVYDRFKRASLCDHFLPSELTSKQFTSGDYRELGDFIEGMYSLRIAGPDSDRKFEFSRKGSVMQDGRAVPVSMIKKVRISSSSPELSVSYRITPSGGSLSCLFAVENVFSFLAGDAPDRYFQLPGRRLADPKLASSGEEREVSAISMVDEWLDMCIDLELSRPASLWRHPVETVSNSDSGFERVYQGSALVAAWFIDVPDGGVEDVTIRLRIGTAAGAGGRPQ